nr:hypothetical protein [Tanacetum cinerariifolium]
MSSNAKVTYSEGKVYPSDDGSQPRCELYLDELTLGATGIITVMVCRSWDVHTLTGCYASTDFVMSDGKHDGATSMRKASAKSGGFVRYLFQLIPLSSIEHTDNNYLIDVVGYATNVDQSQKSGSRTLGFSLANDSEDEVSLSKTAVHTDYSQAKEGTLENLLI